MALFKRGDVWWTRVSHNGKTIQRCTHHTHKGMALAFEAHLRSEMRSIDLIRRRRKDKEATLVTARMGIGAAADRYVETVLLATPKDRQGQVRPWVANELYRVDRVLSYFGYRARLAAVSKWSAIADFNQLLLRDMSAQGANRYLSILRAILNKAYEWGALEYPAYVRLNYVPQYENRYVSAEEEELLLEVAHPHIRDLVIFALDTGCRKNEALFLRWRQVELDRKPRAAVHFARTKNGETRTVPLPHRATRVLRRLKKNARGSNSLVFAYPARKTIITKYGRLHAKRGQIISLSNYDALWARSRAEANFEDVRLHDLRHTYAAKLVRAGVPLVAVGRLLGHKSIEMTMRYAHLAIEDLDDVVSVLDNGPSKVGIPRSRYGAYWRRLMAKCRLSASDKTRHKSAFMTPRRWPRTPPKPKRSRV
jgi:integrase